MRAIVQQDGVALIDELINGYGSTRGISLARTLNRGQVISFIVDAAGSHGNDSTGLIVSIEKQSISTFFDTFDSPPVNTTIWNVIDGFGGHSITNGELTFGQAASANTKNKNVLLAPKLWLKPALQARVAVAIQISF